MNIHAIFPVSSSLYRSPHVGVIQTSVLVSHKKLTWILLIFKGMFSPTSLAACDILVYSWFWSDLRYNVCHVIHRILVQSMVVYLMTTLTPKLKSHSLLQNCWNLAMASSTLGHTARWTRLRRSSNHMQVVTLTETDGWVLITLNFWQETYDMTTNCLNIVLFVYTWAENKLVHGRGWNQFGRSAGSFLGRQNDCCSWTRQWA